MNRLQSLWLGVKGSLWFLPSLMLSAGVVLAGLLVELQPMIDVRLGERWPRLFGAGAEGSQAMLAAIATAMITTAGVVFSITVVALSLTASQYSPRLLRNFMSDRPTQVVLGAFVAIYGYCLVVLRTIRRPDEGEFVPSLAVLGGVVMAFVGVGLLIYFVHHLADSIQVSSIVTRIARETGQAIDRLFPSRLGSPEAQGADAEGPAIPDRWLWVDASATGYLVAVDGEALLARARKSDVVVLLSRQVGDFVVEGRPLFGVSADRPDRRFAESLGECFTIGPQRTVHQDAPFGIQQLVDVALKALSPGINDPTTAVTCIDHLSALLVRLSDRCMPGRFRFDDGTLRLIADSPDFSSMLALSFDQIVRQAGNQDAIYERLLQAIERLGESTSAAPRRRDIARQADAIVERLAGADLSPRSRAALTARALELKASLSADGHPPCRIGNDVFDTRASQPGNESS